MSSVNISNMKNVKNMVKYVEVNKLSKWDINPRIISEQALNDLKYKITKYPLFMEARPILVNVDKTNQLIVFAGNQRLEAIRQLGWKEAPVIIFNDLTDEAQKELAIIDNHNDGEWKLETLKLHFKDINFNKLGLMINFNLPKLQIPAIEQIPIKQGKTEEVQVDNSIKAEQCGYPVNNNLDISEDVNLKENQQEDLTHKQKIKCPHCGKEFEI